MLYALRDATATVESIPLITASILSKKLAEGIDALVLDVKQGSGAFITDAARSRELAETMIRLGADHGCPTTALLTAMDRPLGRACGNALEVEESVMALRGEGPEDLVEVTLALGVEMLVVGRRDGQAVGRSAGQVRQEARKELSEALASGKAARKFQEIIEAQGGNPAVEDDPSVLPQAPLVVHLPSTSIPRARLYFSLTRRLRLIEDSNFVPAHPKSTSFRVERLSQ